jgi:hypothetical protein
MTKELTPEESKTLKEMGDALKEVTKPTPKKAKSLGGGSNDDIKVTSKPVVITPTPEDVTPDTAEEETTEDESFTSDEVKGAVIEATARVLGKAMVLLTKFPDMDFSPDEIESLKEIWIPVMPSMSPTAMAIVGTVVILGSKLAVFMVEKGKQGGKSTAAAQTA